MHQFTAKISLLSVSCFLLVTLKAQKLPVENDLHATWPMLKELDNRQVCIFSPKGKYYAYRYGPYEGSDSLVIASVEGTILIKKEINSPAFNRSLQFTAEDDKVVLVTGTDSAELFDLKKRKTQLIVPDVDFFSLEGPGNRFLVVKHKNSGGVSVYSLDGMIQKKFANHWNYIISNDGRTIYLNAQNRITMLSLPALEAKDIYSGDTISTMDVDRESKDLIVLNAGHNNFFRVSHYSYAKNKFTELFSSSSSVIPENYLLVPFEFFLVPSSDRLLFRVEQKQQARKSDTEHENWTVWSTSNKYITNVHQEGRTWVCVYNIGSGTFHKLYNESEALVTDVKTMARNGNVVTQTKINPGEYYWNDERLVFNLYDLNTGEKKEFHEMPKNLDGGFCMYSTAGKYILWWSPVTTQYLCYEIATGKTHELTERGATNFYDATNEFRTRQASYGVAGWTNNDESVLIYDEFDIWQFDPSGNDVPQNLTAGTGAANFTKIRIVSDFNSLISEKTLLVSLYDIRNKDNGFKLWDRRKRFGLEKIRLGKYCYRDNYSNAAFRYKHLNYMPVANANQSSFIVRRESSTESPNLFFTNDFLNYRPLTNIHPEKNYQWYKTKLIEWPVGMRLPYQGILYYPENLDTSHKYPVIIHYYEKRSDELNVFKLPELSDGEVIIPWYTSHGYAVFIPDMHYEEGNIRASLKFTIEGAIKELKKLNWIDTGNMGIQGHSFGGYQTFSLITSLPFKAAQASSGISDLTAYFSHVFMDGTRQRHIEWDQGSAGAAPWENSAAFVKNSPVYFADSVNTPLLIMHGLQDDNVPISQSYEMYAALRRLKKPSWLLTYKNQHHNLDKDVQLDFTEKQQAFFGYFLKGESKPAWMQ